MSPGVEQIAVNAANAFCKKSFFARATFLLLGPVSAASRSLEMQAISKPLLKVAMSRHMALLREKKIDRAYRPHAQPAICQGSSMSNACSSPSPFDHQNPTLRFVAGCKIMAFVWVETL